MCDYLYPQTAEKIRKNVRPFVRRVQQNGGGRYETETARPHLENGRGRYATNVPSHPAGGVTPQPRGAGSFTYSAGGYGDSRSRKKKRNSRQRRNQGAKAPKKRCP